MKNDLITLKTAISAKENGFDEPVLYYYDGSDMVASQAKNVFDLKNYNVHHGSTLRSAPTQMQLQKYLREIHNIFVTVNPIYYFKGGNIGYAAEVNSLSSKNQGEILLDGFTIYSSYEEALEQGLYEALLLIKN